MRRIVVRPSARGRRVYRERFRSRLLRLERTHARLNRDDTRTLELLSLLGANERSLFAYVCALSPNWQDAEEIMQQVRIRIWQDFDQYDPAKPFGCWARAIAYYLTLAYRKGTQPAAGVLQRTISSKRSADLRNGRRDRERPADGPRRLPRKVGWAKTTRDRRVLSLRRAVPATCRPTVNDSQRAATVAVSNSQNAVRVRRAVVHTVKCRVITSSNR